MPPKTRGSTKKMKVAKENIGGVSKPKEKLVAKVINQRKPLADKTNSASDDNSPPQVNKGILTDDKSTNVDINAKYKVRPRRERILPNRYKENNVLLKIVKNDSKPLSASSSPKAELSIKDTSALSPFKTPQKEADYSLLADRPKRVCRLPSRFKDHTLSPNKFIPVTCIASTPILQNKPNRISNIQSSDVSCNILPSQSKCILVEKVNDKNIQLKRRTRTKASDTNNNAKGTGKLTKRQKSQKTPSTSPIKHSDGIQTTEKKTLSHFTLPVVIEKKIGKRDNSHLDVYEFTYDPNEEPPPKKKKLKRTIKKRAVKPKMFIIKNMYDKNVSKALTALKNAVSKKPSQESQNDFRIKDKQITDQQSAPVISKSTVSQNLNQMVPTHVELTSKSTSNVSKPVTPTVQITSNRLTRVEEIAADFDCLIDHDIDYSPVASPNHGKESNLFNNEDQVATHNSDPLNLQEHISFFDEPPAASSSMNMSVRRPHDSPWRVDFDQLPIKWHINTYVKPNMTPAVECSFINFNDENKKKHVYTDMVPVSNDEISKLVDSAQQNLKQSSILSFFRDRLEKSAIKKKRTKSITPTKANSIFEDVSEMSEITNSEKTPLKECNKTIDSVGKEIENVSRKGTESVKSTAKDKNGTYFGFDDSEDQENVSPIKVINPKVRALRPRGRAVLQEINAVSGPSRANIPLAAKKKIILSSDTVNKAYELNQVTDAPVFPKPHEDPVDPEDVETHNKEDNFDDDSESVHLFEDIEVVHHLKPSRKSYGKNKKVTFPTQTTLDIPASKKNSSDSLSGAEDDLGDLTFNFQDIEKRKPKKKVKKKQLLSRKEKAEMETWAAQFNSMCEDVNEFPLVVE
ncbi:hypothetical protein ACJJTC_016316 [Scirpophaga incertulas]